MSKTRVVGPVVELDGDDMTRIMRQFIEDEPVLAHLEVDLGTGLRPGAVGAR